MSAAQLVEKLVAVMPRPRDHQLHFHGVYGGNAAWRSDAVPSPPKRRPHASRRLTRLLIGSSDWRSWAELIWRTFHRDAWACNRCGKRMVLRAVVIGSFATNRVLAGLGVARAPPVVAVV
jgi:hypothetical protein